MNHSLPSIFHPLLWSYDLSLFDPQKHHKTVIVQVLNYGTLQHYCPCSTDRASYLG